MVLLTTARMRSLYVGLLSSSGYPSLETDSFLEQRTGIPIDDANWVSTNLLSYRRFGWRPDANFHRSQIRKCVRHKAGNASWFAQPNSELDPFSLPVLAAKRGRAPNLALKKDPYAFEIWNSRLMILWLKSRNGIHSRVKDVKPCPCVFIVTFIYGSYWSAETRTFLKLTSSQELEVGKIRPWCPMLSRFAFE
jgi:hypothetical protein